MDDADRAWVDSLIPDGAVVEGYVAAISYIDPSGESHVRVHHDGELMASHLLGMCEMAKHHIWESQVMGVDLDDD